MFLSKAKQRKKMAALAAANNPVAKAAPVQENKHGRLKDFLKRRDFMGATVLVGVVVQCSAMLLVSSSIQRRRSPAYDASDASARSFFALVVLLCRRCSFLSWRVLTPGRVMIYTTNKHITTARFSSSAQLEFQRQAKTGDASTPAWLGCRWCECPCDAHLCSLLCCSLGGASALVTFLCVLSTQRT
jgi:hypothetical protein